MYEIYCKLRDERGIKDADVVRETGITKSTFSDWKNGRSKPKQEKMQKIADFFNVSINYLMTGTVTPLEKKTHLTEKDARDIRKDLDRIMEEIKNRDNGPLYYDGVEIDDESMDFLENAINYALRESKKENKVKYNPNKNKK